MVCYPPHAAQTPGRAYVDRLSTPRHQGLREAGRLAPQTARLRIEELAADLPEATNRFQREGTRQRVESGKASEPTPQIWTPSKAD